MIRRMLLTAFFAIAMCLFGRGQIWIGSSSISFAQENSPQPYLWSDSLETAKRQSAVSGKPILVKFEAVWCDGCKLLNEEFELPRFRTIRDAAILVKIDIDQEPEIAQEYDIQQIPAVVVIDANGDVVSEKIGFAKLDVWLEWMGVSLKDTEFKMPDVLTSNEPPTRTEIKDLIEHLGSRDPTMREITKDRLASFPGKTRKQLVEFLSKPGKLSQKLSVIEILGRWDAPVEGLDPWSDTQFPEEKLAAIIAWYETPIENLAIKKERLTDEDLQEAFSEMKLLIASSNPKSNLARLTRFGSELLPSVYERLESSQSDLETSRLTALRYWLTSSNELRLGWPAGIIELAASDLDSRRNAAKALVDRASMLDEALLLELFADSDPLVRELSLKGLQRVGAKQTDETLVRLLYDPDKNVRAAVLKQFAEAEASHLEGKVAKYLATESDPDLIVHALRFMRNSRSDKSVSAILEFADHERWQVRAEVAETLGEIDNDRLSSKVIARKGEAVMNLLEDDDGFVVSRAVGALPARRSKKMLDTLMDIAVRKPEIAAEIVSTLNESSGQYDSYGNKKSMVPYFKKLVDHKNPAVRLAGLKGLMNEGDVDLKRIELAKLLQDESKNIRIGALKLLAKTLEDKLTEHEEDLTSYETTVYYERSEPTLLSGLLQGVFGGSKDSSDFSEEDEPTKSLETDGDDLPALETTEAQAAEEQSNDAENSDKPKQDNSGDSENDKESAEPDSKPVKKKPTFDPSATAQERFLEEWHAGKHREEFATAIPLVAKLVDAESDLEKGLALYCSVAFGDNGSSMESLLDIAEYEPEVARYRDHVLQWLPPKIRKRTFQAILSRSESGDAASIVRNFANIRNPNLTEAIWDSIPGRFMEPNQLRESILESYFGSNASYYTDFQQEQYPKPLVNFVKSEVEKKLNVDNEDTKLIALAILSQVDLTAAKKSAQKILDGKPNEVLEDLAFRISLRSKSGHDMYSNSIVDNSFAVKYLKTNVAWRYKLVLKYLVEGEQAISQSHLPGRGMSLNYNYYSFSSGHGGDGAKVRVPKAPKGLTLDLLDPADMDLDEECVAFTTYFRALLDVKVDLAPLIDYYQSEKSETAGKLIYRAVATQNRDDLIPIIEKTFEEFGGDESFAADLYWTIRVMDGKQAGKLRKRIRDEIGMETLKHY